MVEQNLPEEISQDDKYNPRHPYVDSNFYYGFAFFRQQKDPTNKRGYLQVRMKKNKKEKISN